MITNLFRVALKAKNELPVSLEDDILSQNVIAAFQKGRNVIS